MGYARARAGGYAVARWQQQQQQQWQQVRQQQDVTVDGAGRRRVDIE